MNTRSRAMATVLSTTLFSSKTNIDARIMAGDSNVISDVTNRDRALSVALKALAGTIDHNDETKKKGIQLFRQRPTTESELNARIVGLLAIIDGLSDSQTIEFSEKDQANIESARNIAEGPSNRSGPRST